MNKKIGNIFKGDKVIWMVFFFLCMISVVEVFSASSNLTYKSHNYIGPIVYHTGTIIFGVVVAIITLNIPCRFFKLMTPFLLFISAVTLIWVLAFGQSINGANRVIPIFGITFQPSEIAKFALILMIADWSSKHFREMHTFKKGVLPCVLMYAIYAALLVLEPHYSGIVIITLLAAIMMYIGGVRKRYFLIAAAALGLILLILIFKDLIKTKFGVGYILED